MSLSSIAVEQREKEAKKLNSFLVFGLISSLALHIGVLSLGIGNLTRTAAEVEDKPLEVEIVELPDIEKLEIEEAPQAKDSSVVGSSSGGSSGSGSIALSGGGGSPARVIDVPSRSPSPRTIAPAKIANPKTPPTTNQKLAQAPKAIVDRPAPVAKVDAPSEIAIKPKPVIAPSPSDQKLRDLLASTRNTQQTPNISAASKPSGLSDRQASIANSLRNQRANGAVDGTANGSSIGTGNNLSGSLSNRIGSGSGSGTGRGSGSGSGSSSGTGKGSGSGNGSGSGTGRGDASGSGSGSATGAQNGNLRTARLESNGNANSRASGLACRSCSKPKYPDRARRRGLEGKAEISVDIDSKGNVTDVRLASSSGHSELDKAALQEARRWKFKAPNGGARGVSAKVDFAIEGSERSRKLRERRKRRQAEQRRSTPTTETANAPTSNRRIRRNSTSTQNASSPRRTQTTTSRRRIDTLPPRRTGDRQRPTTQKASSQTRLRQSLRRQRPTSNQSTPASQTKLRQSLRQLRQNPQPVANPNDE